MWDICANNVGAGYGGYVRLHGCTAGAHGPSCDGRSHGKLSGNTTHHDHRVDFLMRKEITFVTFGSIVGALVMHVPGLFSDFFEDLSHVALLQILGGSADAHDTGAGLLLHTFVAAIMGIVAGVILFRALRLDISHLARGLVFGLLAGCAVFAVFTIPVTYIMIVPSIADDAHVQQDFATSMLISLGKHMLWGLVMGSVTTYLTRKFGAKYRCHICDVAFSKWATLKEHQRVCTGNEDPASMKRVLILGGGYAGVGVLNCLQKQFGDDIGVSITLVNESNFFLHTPMLPEMATGTIEPAHIATPIRKFCSRARFCQARVTEISLKERKVTICRTGSSDTSTLSYDYLVIASGKKTSFYGNENVERNALTLKTLEDAIRIRNHIIGALESADQEPDQDTRQKTMTFVVVGGGFSGVETVGELNSFVRDSVKKYYHNIPESSIRVVLVSSSEVILPEVPGLGVHAMSALTKAGVTIYTKARLTDYDGSLATLNNGVTIETSTLIWAAGSVVSDIVSKLDTEHDRSGRVVVNAHLSLMDDPDTFALGDCASITDPRDGTPYPPTAQHAAQEAKIASANLANRIRGVEEQRDFIFDSKGFVAKIGNLEGVALMMGVKMHGLAAWFVWKHYYLMMLPTTEKKMRIGFDWLIDLFFPRDISKLSSGSVEPGTERGTSPP